MKRNFSIFIVIGIIVFACGQPQKSQANDGIMKKAQMTLMRMVVRMVMEGAAIVKAAEAKLADAEAQLADAEAEEAVTVATLAAADAETVEEAEKAVEVAGAVTLHLNIPPPKFSIVAVPSLPVLPITPVLKLKLNQVLTTSNPVLENICKKSYPPALARRKNRRPSR